MKKIKNIAFSTKLLEVIQNAMEIVENYETERARPIIILKGIIDLDDSLLYDYLMENICYDNSDIEMAFQDTLCKSEFLEKEESKEVTIESKENTSESEKVTLAGKEDDKFMIIEPITQKKLFCTEDVMLFFTRAIEVAEKQAQGKILEVEHVLSAIAENIPKDILMFLRNLGVNMRDFKKTFILDNPKLKNSLPDELKSFMRILNDKYKKGTRCSILERDKECEEVWKTLQKKTKRNVILIGEPGVGKSSIAKKITHDIVNGNCPSEFKNFMVITVDVNSTIAGTMYRGEAEERFQKMIDFLEKADNVILFIDEIHTILGAGACKDGEMDLANALKPILAEDKVRVIGATTSEEYEKYFSKDSALKRRFRPVEVKEPNSKKVYPMLKNAISDLSKYHGVKISKAMVEYAILISSCFNYETKNPDRTLDLIDLSMVTAKSDGKDFVDKESILKNFDINFEKFEKMDYKVKKSTAYHEAGHYLVWRFSENLKDIEGIAVSIMPASDYLGVTVYDELDEEVTVPKNMEYYIDNIAKCLAGRVAEKMYTNTISSGASADIESATKLAYILVTEYGMTSEFSKNRSYINYDGYDMYNEKTIDNINKEIDKIIDMAYKKAETILQENMTYLKKLVNLLMRKGIVSKKELDKIFEDISRD